MTEYKVKIKKLNGNGSSYIDVTLSLTDEQSISEALEQYFKNESI